MSCLSLLLWHPLQLQHQLLLELPLHLQELLPLPIHLSLLVFQNLYFLALKRKQNCSYYWDEDYLGWGFFFARAWPNTLRTSWLSFAITIVSRGFSSASSSAAVSLLRLRCLLLSVCVSLIKIGISSWALWKWQYVVSFREPVQISRIKNMFRLFLQLVALGSYIWWTAKGVKCHFVCSFVPFIFGVSSTFGMLWYLKKV